MDGKEEEALPSAGMTGYHNKHFTSHLNQDQQESNSGFSFLPQFPRIFNLNHIFGRFSNIIPEETEDAVKSTMNPVSKSSEDAIGSSAEDSIAQKVQQLRLTAQSSPENNRFEPFWIQIEPKTGKDKGHVRRHSSGLIKNKISKQIKSCEGRQILDDTNIDHPLYQADDIAGREYYGNQINFDEMKIIPNDTATNTALDSAAFAISIRGNVFRKPADAESLQSFQPFRRGEIFRAGKGMRKSSSMSSLQNLENEVEKSTNLEGMQDIKPTESKMEISESSVMRRTSSTGDLQQLQSQKNVHEDEEQFQDKNRFENQKDENKPSMGEKLNKIRKETANWATTNKVRQKRREHQFFTPTSF